MWNDGESSIAKDDDICERLSLVERTHSAGKAIFALLLSALVFTPRSCHIQRRYEMDKLQMPS